MRNILILLFLISLCSYVKAEVKIKVEIKGDVKSVARIQSILPKLEKVLNSKELKDRLLKVTFTTTKLSNAEIVKKLLEGEWALKLEFKRQVNWRGKCNVLGWTYPSTQTIWINSCGFEARSDAGIAGTLAHEFSHKLGFDHKNARDLMSVPYSFGNVVSEIYEKTYGKEK